MSWKDTIKAIAPTVGALLGGPLAGTAVKILTEKVLGDPNAGEAELERAVSAGLSPEQIAAVRQAELRAKEIDAEILKAAMADTANAREAHKGDPRVFWLGIAVLVTFMLVMIASMVGAYQILTGGITIKDIGVVAAVFGFIGTVVGYVAANAQQVVGYFFGSSAGSKGKTDAMAQAFAGMVKR